MERLLYEVHLTTTQEPNRASVPNKSALVTRDRPHSVNDILNGAVGENIIQNRSWLRVSREPEVRAQNHKRSLT